MSEKFTSLEEFKRKALENPEVKQAYEEKAPEFELRSKLIELRKKSGLSQQEIAERMGTSKQSICRIESAKHSPKYDTIIKYARAAGFNLKLHFERQ